MRLTENSWAPQLQDGHAQHVKLNMRTANSAQAEQRMDQDSQPALAMQPCGKNRPRPC